MDVCRPIRARGKQRLGGLAQTGYCPALQRRFHGVREHLVWTPEARIAFVLQLPGRRHDVQGLYALLETAFRGHLLGDNAYWPRPDKRRQLARQQITVTADVRGGWHVSNPPDEQALLKAHRHKVERWIGLFDAQFHGHRTRCRSRRHYEARRWTKTLAHNLSRHVNREHGLPKESVAHFVRAA